MFEPSAFGNLPCHSNHLHNVVSKLSVVNSGEPELLVGFSSMFGSMYVNGEGLSPRFVLQDTWGVFWGFLENSHMWMFIYVFLFLCSQANVLLGVETVRMLPASVPVLLSETRGACFRRRHGWRWCILNEHGMPSAASSGMEPARELGTPAFTCCMFQPIERS